MARRLMRSIMMCCRRVSGLDTNRGRDGHAARPAPLRTHRSPATVALPFALMCAIIAVGSTCQSLICEPRRNQSISATLRIGGNSRHRWQLSASIACVVLRSLSGGHHEAFARSRWQLTQVSSSHLPRKYGSKLSLDHHSRCKETGKYWLR